VEGLRKQGIATVLHGNFGWMQRFDRVCADQEQGCYELTRWMISQGRRRILRLWTGGPEVYWIADRNRGYERAVREAGVESVPAVYLRSVPRGVPPQKAMKLAEDPDVARAERQRVEDATRIYAGYLIEHLTGRNPIDAVLLTSDGEIFSFAKACALAGKQPGRDVLVGGYDGYWRDCWERQEMPIAPAATVNKQNDLIGEELCRLLLDRLGGCIDAAPQCRTVPPRLEVVGRGGAV
jgi:DNA-binding LacI/PurR family transcriptional regulator